MSDVIENETTEDQTTDGTDSSTTEDEDTPVITLIVEDGSGKQNANSYVDLDFFNSYNLARGRSDLSDLSDEDKKKCLVLGSDYIDKKFKWYGRRKFRDQAFAFPRVDLFDSDGFRVDDIPLNLKKAVCEAGYLISQTGDLTTSLFVTKDADGSVKREKVDVLEMEYFENSSTTVDYTSIYEVLNTLLDGLYKTDSDSTSYNVGAIWLG